MMTIGQASGTVTAPLATFADRNATGGTKPDASTTGVATVPTDRELPCDERLKAILLENQRLREQIKQLMQASSTFGQLAERLNAELQLERRGRVENRRRLARAGFDVVSARPSLGCRLGLSSDRA
jgi:hypothetical protein